MQPCSMCLNKVTPLKRIDLSLLNTAVPGSVSALQCYKPATRLTLGLREVGVYALALTLIG